MPQVILAAATAIVSAIGLTGTVAGAVATVALEALAYAGIAALTTPRVGAAEGRPTQWSADPDAPIPFVFGRRALAGQIVHRDTFGPDNRYQGIVTVYSGGGPINAFGDTIVDSVARTFTGETMNGSPTGGLYRQTRLGAQPDTALTSPSVGSALSTWGSTYKLSGKACSMITLAIDSKMSMWPTGEPKVLQVIQGVLAWDPRLDSTWPGGSGSCRLATPSTWVYSTNPIIHALKWALGLKENGILVGGIGASVGAIDVASFISAANVADTNSWTGAAIAYSLDDKFQVFSAMLQAGGAVPARKAGQISCISRGAAPASVVTISAADTAGPFEFQAGSPRSGRINTIIPRCVSESHDWEMVDLSPVSNSTYITEDGGATRSKGVDYAYVSAKDQAAQLARYDIADSREGITGTIPLKPYMRDLAPGDAFTITDDGLALSGQKCLVLSRSYDPKSDVVQVTFRSETAAKHAWALSGTGTLPATPSLGTVDPSTVPTPSTSDWTLAAGAGGVPSLVITGAVPSTVNASAIVVEYKTVAGATWILAGEYNANTVKVEIPGLTAATAYTARVSYRSTFDTVGSAQVLTATPTTGTVAGGGITADTVDTTQVASKAVHQVGSVYSDSLRTQANQTLATNFGNELLSLTVTTTGNPVYIDVHILDAVVANADYYYYLHIDNTFSVVGSNEVNHYDELKMRIGATVTATARNPRSFRWLVAGLSAASHTFRVYLRNTSGGSMDITNRSLSITEMKKAT